MRKNICYAAFIVAFGSSFVLAQGMVGAVAGRVTEKLSGRPVAGVTVFAGGREAKTDDEGNYRLEVPAGEYNLRFSAPGFVETITSQITVTANRTFVQNAKLEIILSREMVEVRNDIFADTDDKPVSQTLLNRDEIRNTPGSGGDPLRAISSLPSVTAVGAEFGDYFVRGGKADENLVWIDNIPVADFTLFSDKYDGGKGGRGSVLASDVIEHADFSAGGFGARFGDKMSSVLDIDLRESNRKRVQMSIFSDLGNAGGSVEVPFGKRGGWLTSVRRSYFDVVFDVLKLGDIGRPRNWDIINHGVYEIGRRNKLSLTAIDSFETFDLSPAQAREADRRTDRLETDRRSRRGIFGATLSSTIGDKTFSQLTAWGNVQHVDGSLWRLDTARTLQRTRDLRDSQFGVKEEITASIWQKAQLALGGGVYSDQARYFSFERTGFGYSPLEEEYNAPNRTSLMSIGSTASAYAYSQFRLTPVSRFSITPGLRVEHFGLTGETKVSPRLSARFTAAKRLAFTFATGVYRQLPGLYAMSLTPANRGLKTQSAFHIIGGVEWLATEDIRVRAEVFSKKYDDLVVQPILGNFNYSNAGSGRANGVEISMQKALSGHWAGQISYSFTDSKRRLAPGGFAFPTDEDRPHQFTAIGITRVFGIIIAGKYRVASGLPYDRRTAIRISTSPSFFLQRLVSTSDSNALRLPFYRDFDMRVEKKFNFRRLSVAPYLDVLNAFSLNYKTQVDYEFNRSGVLLIGEGVRIPLFGLRIEF